MVWKGWKLDIWRIFVIKLIIPEREREKKKKDIWRESDMQIKARIGTGPR